MFLEILRQSWEALNRHRLRSFLTMLGIVWGIVAVAILIAYGHSFRVILVRSFEAFGRSAVVCWPGQTSEQAGGERAGRRVRFEKEDLEIVRQEAGLVKQISLETVRWLAIAYGDRVANTAIRGVYPEYGEIRNQVANHGRWITPEDFMERRRVVILGGRLREKLFGGRPAVDETVQIGGVRFMVIGTMARKLNMSSYFTSDDESAFIPYTAAGDLWNSRYANVLVFAPIAPTFEKKATEQVRAAIAKRQRFSPTDKRAITAYGREEFRPIIDSITIGLQALLVFIGALTLGIGGVGVMNIMLVSVDERIREIGLRRALGARRRHIRRQFLSEALVLTLMGGIIGILAAYLVAGGIGRLPLLGPILADTTGDGDIHLRLSAVTIAISTGILILVGMISGFVPALRAARLDPVEALRYE
ncbi:MAG: ABC transporter permease [Acidobacteria bacterium]|nr:ABC transporter permease [Acidobacteriota bacterium]MBI3658190.1 ABC transporter permease [Acidobacteriota bacterium]